MGSFIIYRIQQTLPAKLEKLHELLQNSDEQFAPQCGANLKPTRLSTHVCTIRSNGEIEENVI